MSARTGMRWGNKGTALEDVMFRLTLCACAALAAALVGAPWAAAGDDAPVKPPAAERGGLPSPVTDDAPKAPPSDAPKAPADKAAKKPAAEGAAPDAAAQARPQSDRAVPSTREEIVQCLDATKLSVDFNKVPLDDALEFLHSLSRINFVVHPRVKEENAGEMLKVTLSLRDVSLRSVLKYLCDLSNTGLVLEDGVLMVQPASMVTTRMRMRIYSIEDLLQPLLDFPGPDLELKASQTELGLPPDTFSETVNEPDPGFTPDTLILLIKNATGAEVWEGDAEAQGAMLKIQKGKLFTVHTSEVQKQVQEFIQRLRDRR